MTSQNRSRLIRRIVYVLVTIVIITFIVTRVFNSKTESNYTTEKVSIENLTQNVEVSGTTEVGNRYGLQFLQSGKLGDISVKTGDRVKAGDVLATLENGDVALQLESQKAALHIAQANLAKSIAGPRREEVNLNKLKIDLANVDLTNASNAQKNLLALARKNAEITALGLEQAKANFNQAQNTLNFAINNRQIDLNQSQLNINNAQVNSNQGQQDLQYTTASGNLGLRQNQDTLNPRFQSLLQSDLGFLQTTDSILGVNTNSVLGPNFFLLGNGNNQKILETKNLFLQARADVNIFQNQLQNFNNFQNFQTDDLFNKAQIANNSLSRLALNTKDLLSNTGSNEIFTVQQLTQLIQQFDGSSQNYQQNYQTLLQNYQSLQTLEEKVVYNNNSSTNALQIKNNNQSTATFQFQQTQLAAQKKIDDANTAIQQAQISLNQAQENYNKAILDFNRQADDLNSTIQKAQIGVKSANEQLNLLQAPQREVDIAPIKGQVDQAWDAVHLAEYRLEQTQLKAPTDGVITAINTDIGENISLGQPLITLDANGFYIKSLVSEADIIKIQEQNPVKITFDALGIEKEFTGNVQAISPAETIVQGVIYYEIKVQFDGLNEKIKPGMTANLTIQTAAKENILIIPIRAIQYENNKPFVQVLTKDEKGTEKIEKREVTTGLEGDQNIEITSGLKEGEEVVTFTKTA